MAVNDILCYLGLGSNLGDRAANLAEAGRRMEKLGLRIVKASSIYETEPVGYKDQPWFLNQVVGISLPDGFCTASAFANPPDLLRALLAIENEMGRERTIPGGPRIIDIDLLLCGNCIAGQGQAPDHDAIVAKPHTAVIEGELGLILPHPRLHQRRFVLEPLCEIAPDLMHPVLGKTCAQLLKDLDDPSPVKISLET